LIKIQKLSDKGVALPTVIMVMLVAVTFVGIVLTLVTSQSKTEVFYEDNSSALHAAEAGVNMYLWDLNKDTGTSVLLNTTIQYPETNPVAAYYLDEVEAECTESKKVVTAMGWMLSAPDVKRTVKVTFTKRSFTQYVYFSDNDPDNIYWSTSDNLYGPFRSNTYLCIMGSPTFWGKVKYVKTPIKYYSGTNNPVFKQGKEVVAREDFPENNSELMNIAKSGGYYYEGRTSILLNSNGTMTIWNPNPSDGKPDFETKNLPSNGVIYVNDKSGTSTNKFDPDNGNVFIAGVLDGRLTVAAKRDIYITGYDPTQSSYSSSTITNGITYKDTSFTLNTVTGEVTVVENGGTGESDLLGLIADRHVAVLTYGWFNDSDANSARRPMNVYGAIFAISGSFINSYQIDSDPSSTLPSTPGVLTVRGAIIQSVRGAVAKGTNAGVSSGYAKDYAHDPRLMYDQPPHFLEPTASGWEIYDWKETN
jgi:hypothetical protein